MLPSLSVSAVSTKWPITFRPLEPDGGSRLPWKSLNDRSWMSIVGPFEEAVDDVDAMARPVADIAATASTPVRRRLRAEVMDDPL